MSRLQNIPTILALAVASACSTSNGDTTVNPARRVLEEQVARGNTPGLQYLLVSEDSILFRHQAGLADVAAGIPVTPATTFNGFSVTKTFTAVAILQLVERGVVDLDQPASAYLTPFPYPANITLRHLLTHTAGMPNPIPLRWVHLDAEHATFDRDAFFRQEYARHSTVKGAPNERFAYSNLGYELLGEVIEAVTGMSYEQYVSENILARIGVAPAELGFALGSSGHARGYHKRRSLSYPILGFIMDKPRVMEGREGAWQKFRPYYMNGAAYGGLVGTADGFARYLQALLDTSNTLLPESSRTLLFTENILSNGKASGMTLSWFKGELDGHAYFNHAGGGGGYYAELRIYPELRLGSVVMFNRTGMSNTHFLDQVDRPLIHALGARATAGAVQPRALAGR